MRTRKGDDGTTRPKRIRPLKLPELQPKVTVHVTVRNTPPDSARLAAQRKAMEVILAALARD
jgi:hypothetical protein